jgi:DNA replication protein DnaC
MLFTSWRGEITDLLGNCTSYQEHYFQVKNTIDEQMKCYAMCSEDLNVIQDKLNSVEDSGENYDLITSGTQNIERQEQDDVYREMVQKLNREQKEFFFHVLHPIKTPDNPFYCFLSGGGGVGKSHLTKCLYQAALKY